MISFKHGPRGVNISGKPFEIAEGTWIPPIERCETFESLRMAAGDIVYCSIFAS